MDITLTQPWNGLPVGFRLVGVQAGQAELMVKRGLAEKSSDKIDESKQQQRQQPRKQK
jgi:hypothetical protein